MVIVYGPTGVGKSSIAEAVAKQIPAAIVNLDMGQCYTPLSIGTAKPDWQNSAIPHYLFDCMDEPKNFTVTGYRHALLRVLEDVWSQGRVPLIVGGSGFYLKSLFYPPQERGERVEAEEAVPLGENLWDRIHRIDPERAARIHPHDEYRLKRAYALWQKTGQKPSTMSPVYQPPASYLLVCLTRDREDLYARINDRVVQMIDHGWIKEVEKIKDTAWEPFLREKKIIGYDDLLAYLHDSSIPLEEVIARIQQKTRHYAKRQFTFWRMLERQLLHEKEQEGIRRACVSVNLTLSNVDLYISQLSDMILKYYTEE